MSNIILITGASSGIGKATALKLIKEGHTVYGAARSIEKMQEIKDASGHILKMDITDDQRIQAATDRIMEEQGRIDVLVNNAGFGLYGSVEETSIEDARYQFEVNLFGLARLTQLVLPHMRAQQSGTIVNISSMGGKIYTPLGAWYHATKHAIEGWSDCLRIEVQQFGIHVVIVEPGLIETEFGETMMNPMLKRSGQGSYKTIANAMAKGVRDSYKPGGGSPPRVIANVIARAVESRRPHTRYVAGKMAKPVLFLRWLLPDRWFDRLVLRQIQ